MIIECHKCKSLFRLDEGLLREKGSKVRCSLCTHVFITYPPGRKPTADEKPKSPGQILGETVILEFPPVLEDEESEPLLEELGDQEFEAAFEEEAVTKRLEAVSRDGFPQQEPDELEEFHLEIDDQEKEEIDLQPAVEFQPAAELRMEDAKVITEPLEKPEKEIQPKTRKAKRSRMPFILLFILLLLIGAGAAIVVFAPERIPQQLGFLTASQKGEATDPGVVRLRFTSVSGSFVQNANAGQLFVVRGAISNTYGSSRSFVLVKGSILDDKGKVVKTKVAYAGNVFTEDDLQNFSMEQIDQGLRNRAGKADANVNIQPQASVPFMIVFEDLPENLSEFTVEPVSSSAGQ
jgi:pilus assembly protein FimV